MKACIVFAHEGTNSFNHEILARAVHTLEKMRINTTVRDLYEMKFQPVYTAADMNNVEHGTPSADMLEEQTLITDADLLVMIYPVWWWSQPAILKGYIDRVFTDGFAFRYESTGPVGLLKGKQAFVFTTTRESEQEMAATGLGDVVKKQVTTGTLEMIGYDVEYHNFAAVTAVDDAARSQMLRTVEETITSARLPVGV